MKHINTSIQINANIKTVWSIFSNFEAYPEWNPFLTSVIGNPVKNERLEIEALGMKFNPVVEKYHEFEELTWQGKLLFKGVFDGRHSFIFKDNGNNTTTFIHNEEFKGILVHLMRRKLYVNTKNGFIAMNQKLKELSEQNL